MSVVSSRQTAPLCFCLCFSPSFHSSFSSFSLLFKTDAKLTETKQRTCFFPSFIVLVSFFLSLLLLTAYHTTRGRGGGGKERRLKTNRAHQGPSQNKHCIVQFVYLSNRHLPTPLLPPKKQNKITDELKYNPTQVYLFLFFLCFFFLLPSFLFLKPLNVCLVCSTSESNPNSNWILSQEVLLFGKQFCITLERVSVVLFFFFCLLTLNPYKCIGIELQRFHHYSSVSL